MKSELSNTFKQAKDRPYPKLMVSIATDAIILFEKHAKGAVVFKGKGKSDVGVMNDEWNMDVFTDLDPEIKVTLQND